ncbi:hypothetical protein [Polynucleobacter necessarius]|uniref:hypothetical protein n=1 Tax=Polynucleobacter necessarius TaxID=576610 RepID=UPI0013B069EB|nr:hypothetical protein [Polynucleobacter necessarius]
MLTHIFRSSTYSALLGIPAMGRPSPYANAPTMQTDHSLSSASAMQTKFGNVCQGGGLKCANAATPFFTPDGKSLDVGSDARPQIVVDKQGNAFVAHSFFKESHWNAQINIARSADGAKTFSIPESLVYDESSQRFSMVLVKPDASIFITWIDKRIVAKAKKVERSVWVARLRILFLEKVARHLKPSSLLTRAVVNAAVLGASLDSRANPTIIYRAIFPGGIRDQATQVINTKGAEPVRRISDDEWKTDACPHHGPSIAVSGSGKFHVSWDTQDSKRAGVFYANSSNEGKRYSKPIRVGSEVLTVTRPYLFTSGQQVWLVWKECDGNKSSVYLKESPDDGKSWSAPKLLTDTAGYGDHPLLASRGDAVFLSWLTWDDGYQLINIGRTQ